LHHVACTDWVIEASADVQGTQRTPYTTHIRIELDAQDRLKSIETDCSCPMGPMCKHTGALAIVVQAELQDRHEAAHPPQPLDPQTLLRQQEQQRQLAEQRAEHALLRWFTASESDQGHGKTVAGNSYRLVLVLQIRAMGHFDVLTVRAMQALIKKNGEWGKPHKLENYIYESDPFWKALADEERDVLRLLKSLDAYGSGYSYSTGFSDERQLQGLPGQLILQKASAQGRLFWSDTVVPQKLTPMHWSSEQERLKWLWATEPTTAVNQDILGERQRLKMQLDNGRLCMNAPALWLDLVRAQVGLVDVGGRSPQDIRHLLSLPPLDLDTTRKYQLHLHEVLQDIGLPPVVKPPREVRDLSPVPVALVQQVEPDHFGLQGLCRVKLLFRYGDMEAAWPEEQPRALIRLGDESLVLWRDLGQEMAWRERLESFGLYESESDLFVMAEDDHLWFDWLQDDFAAWREAGFEVRCDPTLAQWLQTADEVHVGMAALNGEGGAGHWFDLSLGMEIHGERINILPWVPWIVSAMRADPHQAHTVGDDLLPDQLLIPRLDGQPGFVRLPTDRLKPWLQVLLELHADPAIDWNTGGLRLSRAEALRTASALGEGVQWSGLDSLQSLVQSLRGQQTLPSVPPPQGLQAELRPYQQQGLNWLQFLRAHQFGGILADDMGLGKTLQTLAHILTEKQAGRLQQPALIVVPVSLLGNWQREARRFTPDLRVHVHHGAERHDQPPDWDALDVVITSYALLTRDAELWRGRAWHLLVLDEAQNIKNAKTQAAQLVSEISASHRLCLSGTPMENHLGEIWSLFNFLMPGFLGSHKRFTEWFRTPIERQANTERLQQLRARVTPFMLRRTKNLVASELPAKVETVMPVALTGRQADLYETIRLSMEKTVREALASKGLARSQITILDALLKLRQVCCDPRLLKAGGGKVKISVKLDQLLAMLPEMVAEGRRILLFSQFTEMLSLIEEALPALGIEWVKLTGQSTRRDAIVERFTSGQVPLFLISLKAGGVGLNLPQADTVIHFDPWWNPAVENQATDRAHRIGQTQSVWVVKLVAQGTIEERMLALQERKAQLAQDIYQGAAQRKEPLFGEDDLAELLKPINR